MKQIATALLKAQSEMSNPKKGATNPYFKSKYADLNAVREAIIPTLNQNGITVLQPMISIEGKNYIRTVLLHESGEFIESHTEIIYSKSNDAQAQGSGITYARRYGLQSLVCIGADDDDGNKASNPPAAQGNINTTHPDEPSQTIFDMINKASNLDELKEIWQTYPHYQRHQGFKDAINSGKRKYEVK